MHDVTVAARIIETVEGCKGLKSVFVTIGKDSCVRPEMLEKSFDEAKRGTAAEQARLVAVPGPGADVTVISVEVDE